MTEYINKLKKMGDLPKTLNNEPKNAQEFEEMAENFSKIYERLEIENEALDGVFRDLKEVFGEETINLFTKNTKDVDLIMPLIEFVIPYVEKVRNEKVSKYINIVTDVME